VDHVTDSATLVAGRYRLRAQLGAGGMGRVWLATDEVLNRDVAVKEVLPPPGISAAELEEVVARTVREARATAKLAHPNVVRVYDVVLTGGVPWIVMEYVESQSLSQRVYRDGTMAPVEAARVGLGVLAALRAAHRVGVLHRDVKPANVLLTPDGRVVLTDFGLATIAGDPALTLSGVIMGSPSYMSPERAMDGPVGAPSDLWALGATLFYAVEGRPPYDRGSTMATLAALAVDPPPHPTRAGPLTPVIDGLLRRDPQQRLDAAATQTVLERVVAENRPRVAAAYRPPRRGVPDEASAAPAPATAPVGEPSTRTPPPTTRRGKTPRAKAPRTETPRVKTPRRAPSAQPPNRKPVVLATRPNQSTVPSGRGEQTLTLSRRPRWWFAVVALTAVAIVAVAVALALRPQETAAIGRTPGAATIGAPAPSPTSEPTSEPAPEPAPATPPTDDELRLPDGWHVYRDVTGFSVAVPESWPVTREGTMVYFREPGGPRVLGIDQTDTPQPDPVADWAGKEAYRVARGDFPEYERVRLVEVDYFVKAADWEFTYLVRNARVHVNNRGFIVSPTKAYGMWWSTSDARWTDHLPDLELIQRSFVPA
jgi:serine/threonine protein kinase